MRSLRGQLILLLTASVLGALSMLAWLSGRTAERQFTQSIQRMRIKAESRPSAPPLVKETFARGGWAGLQRELREPPDASPARLLVFDTTGQLRYAPSEQLAAAHITFLANDGVRLEIGRDRSSQIEVFGGSPLRAADGTVVGRVFPLPMEVDVPIEIAAREFSTGFSARVWLGVAFLLVLTTVAGAMLSTRLLRPVAVLTRAAERIGAGDYAARVGPVPLRELEPLATAFDSMASGIDRSEQLRRNMLRDVAHELRTPLTNLRGQIESLLDGLRAPTGDALQSLHEEALLLERLVRDLDALARSDAGELEMSPVPLDVSAEIERAIEGFTQSGRVTPAGLRFEGEPGLTARADRERLGQILRNLIENALSHGASPDPIVVRAGANGPWAQIAVADHGPGIAPEHVERVFERLYRPDPSRARATGGGAGLGLAIVKALVEGQHGTVGLESRVGHGTTVTVRLPLSS